MSLTGNSHSRHFSSIRISPPSFYIDFLLVIIYYSVGIVNSYTSANIGLNMSSHKKLKCKKCGTELKRYDQVSRIIRTKYRKTTWIKVERFQCPCCGQIHRKLPDDIFPYKQYDAEIIKGVLEGIITCETYGYEDYPCEATMKRWRSTQKLQLLL